MTKECRAVANYIIEEINQFNKGKQFREQVSLSTKKLQKLLYFCDVEYMKRNDGKPMFEDDFYAWPSGPVIPNIYSEYAQFLDGVMGPIYNGDKITLSKEIKTIIDLVLEATKDLDTIDLVNISNVVDGPCSKVFKEDDPQHRQIISKEDIYNYYLTKEIIPKQENSEVSTKSLYRYEIIELKDKELQLRYILGGLYPHGNLNCDNFWGCDIRCSTSPVPNDEKLQKVKNFISKHNISNSTFLRLTRAYLFGTFNSYKGDWGSLIPELDRTIMGYNFVHTDYDSYKENDLKEKELLELIEKEANVQGANLNNFLTRYTLTPVDFMILAKTSVNYKFKIARGFEKTDLITDLQEILSINDLYQSYEWVTSYRKHLEEETKQGNQNSVLKKIKSKFTKK